MLLQVGIGAPAGVRLVQERLNAHGFGPLEVDGDFGIRTEAAVRTFQAQRGLPVDGIVDEATLDALLVVERVALTDAVRAEQMSWAGAQIPRSTPPANHAVLRAAISKLGLTEVPQGSNHGPGLDEIVSGYYSPEDEERLGAPPWCVLFACWALAKGIAEAEGRTWDGKDYSKPFGRRLGAAFQLQEWAQATGHVRARDKLIPGAVFVMDRVHSDSDRDPHARAGHVGFVIAPAGGGGAWTIEGNVSNAVKCVKRPLTAFKFLVHWW